DVEGHAADLAQLHVMFADAEIALRIAHRRRPVAAPPGLVKQHRPVIGDDLGQKRQRGRGGLDLASPLGIGDGLHAQPAMSSTMRPSIWPLCIWPKMSLMSSSFARCTVALTLPSPAKSSDSCRSSRVPTIEPRTVMPFS